MTASLSGVIVTAVIPAYNAERFILKAVDSVLAQEDATVEIIVVDDCSTDKTSELLLPHVEAGKVRLIRHDVNKGLTGTRNTAIRHSTGKYIAFLDADDQWLSHHVATAVRLLEKNEDLDVVLQNFDIVDMNSGQFLGNWFEGKQDALDLLRTTVMQDADAQRIESGFLAALIQNCFLHMQAIVARKSIFDHVMFDERLKRSEDVDWSARATHLRKARWAYVKKPSGLYFRHENSLTTNTNKNNDLIARTGALLFREYIQWDGLSETERTVIRRAVVDSCLEASYYARLDHRLRDAWVYWAQSLPHELTVRQMLDGAKLLFASPRMMMK
nr:glycosyltransferase family 2 protein [uncultured Aquabacterium sp.]